RFTTLTSAPATGWPCGSVTVPAIAPVVTPCALTPDAPAPSSIQPSSAARAALLRIRIGDSLRRSLVGGNRSPSGYGAALRRWRRRPTDRSGSVVSSELARRSYRQPVRGVKTVDRRPGHRVVTVSWRTAHPAGRAGRLGQVRPGHDVCTLLAVPAAARWRSVGTERTGRSARAVPPVFEGGAMERWRGRPAGRACGRAAVLIVLASAFGCTSTARPRPDMGAPAPPPTSVRIIGTVTIADDLLARRMDALAARSA